VSDTLLVTTPLYLHSLFAKLPVRRHRPLVTRRPDRRVPVGWHGQWIRRSSRRM